MSSPNAKPAPALSLRPLQLLRVRVVQPFFETGAAQYIKPSWLTLDLGTPKAVEALSKYEDVTRTPEELARQGTYWHHSSRPGVIAALKDQRLPPLVPEEFAARAESKALTNGKDKQALLDMQREVSTTVLAGVQEMSFARLGWGDDDAALLAKALQLCKALRSLDLSGNGIGSAGGVALAPSIAASASLTSVSLLGNNFDDETASMLLKVKEEKPTLVTLCGLTPDQTEAKFMGWDMGPTDAKLLAPEIAVHASLTSLDVRYNSNMGADGKAAIQAAVRGKEGFKLYM